MKYSSNDNSTRRNDRLRRVEKLAIALMGLSIKQFHKLVHSLHDEKGELRITWIDEFPTYDQQRTMGIVWGLSHEDRHKVRHDVIDLTSGAAE